MSKYEELKAEVEKANQKKCTCSGFAVQYDGCSCENGKAQSFAIARLHEFERGAAELIERAHTQLKSLCAVCAAYSEVGKPAHLVETRCDECDTAMLLIEMEAL